MSATILQFTPKAPAANLHIDCGLDISPPDKRGFVIVDACVSMTLALEFMELVTRFADIETPTFPAGVPAYDRPEFDFEITQPGAGSCLIDACVPQALAFEFRDIRANVALPATAA